MPRPSTTLTPISSQVAGWDEVVDDNNDSLRENLFLAPYPLPLVHKTTEDSESSPLSNFAASNYKWCMALVVDATTPATNGHLIYSDGTNWLYSRSGNTV